MKTNEKNLSVWWIGLLAILLCSSVSGTPGKSHRIPSGYITGSDFLKMTALEQSAYATGLTDGYLAAPHFSGASPGWKQLYTCLTQRDYDGPGSLTGTVPGMSNEQVVAILHKYVADHPEEWHLPMNAIGISAFYKSCVIKKY